MLKYAVADPADYSWLTGDVAAGWMARAANDPRTGLQLIESLRRDLGAERARLVVEQATLRRRAVDKFGQRAATMFFTRQLLEQATDIWTARYKARRLCENGHAAADYCCGIGGDLIALSELGPAAGFDVSLTACVFAAANAQGRAAIARADVATLSPEPGTRWHLDPDRRASGRRVTHFADYQPGPDLVSRWCGAPASGGLKLAPATETPSEWAAYDAIEREWISRDGECRQQVVWFGELARTRAGRTATIVRREGTYHSVAGVPVRCESADAPADYLYDPDASLLAADLLGVVAVAESLQTLGAGRAYLTGQRVDHAMLARFRVLDCLPPRTGTLARYLADRGVGRLEIKKRGSSADLEVLRRQLKLRGDNAATLILTRVGRRELAIVAERESH